MIDVESPDYRYSQWAGNHRGIAQDPDRCVEVVYPKDGWVSYQCRFKRKHGLYCGKHKKEQSK